MSNFLAYLSSKNTRPLKKNVHLALFSTREATSGNNEKSGAAQWIFLILGGGLMILDSISVGFPIFFGNGNVNYTSNYHVKNGNAINYEWS